MVTINLDVLRAGATMPRAFVNGQQWIEAEILRAGAVMPATPIRSSEDVHTVLDWTPDDNSIGHEIGGPVTVNFEATKGELAELDFTDTESFDDDGTHNGTVSSATAIELATTAELIDFEDYVGGNITGGSQPHSWTSVSPYDNNQTWIDPADSEKLCVRALNWNHWMGVRLDDAGGSNLAGVIAGRVRFESDVDQQFFVSFNLTGSGSAMRGHYISWGTQSIYASFGRWSSGYDGTYGIRVENMGFEPAVDTWYRFKVRFWTTEGVSMGAQFKFWEDGTTEPESYSWGGSDTAYTVPGYVAINTKHSSANPVMHWDDFQFMPDPPIFETSGNWESDPLNVSAAEIAAGHRINFDTTTPTDTTAAVKCCWGEGDAWLTCTDGEKLPGLLYREDMSAGSARATLYLRIELATTDTNATPEIDNLIINFDPCIFEDIELVVDGQSATRDNDHLAKWGREQISGGVLVEAFDDLFVQAHSFESYRLQGEAITAIFKYDDFTVGDIVFSQLVQVFKVGASDGYFAFRGGAIEAVAAIQYTPRTTWSIAYHDYNWTLIDKTQGIHADAWFWVGHAQADDFPGSMIAAELQLSDHLGSILANAYKRDDFLGDELIQGYRFDDSIGSILPALEKLNDFLGMEVVAIEHRTDAPGSLLVYGVNRRNEIEIQTIDADTVAELELLGFVFPPEAP